MRAGARRRGDCVPQDSRWPDRRRSARSATTRFVYDGEAIIAELDPEESVQQHESVIRRYVHGAGVDEPLAWYEGGGTTDRRFLVADERGSIVAVTSGAGTGQIIRFNSYDAYGQRAAANLGRFGFTGQMWLAEAGVWHYKARAYHPGLGRFLQTDPIRYGDGMNLYLYARNDPLNLSDPTGECPTCISIGVGAAVGGIFNAGFYALQTTRDGTFTWGGLAANAAEGAVVGAVIGSGAGLVDAVLVGASANVVEQMVTTVSAELSGQEGAMEAKYGDPGSFTAAPLAMAEDAGVGAFGGAVGLAGSKVAPPIAEAAARAFSGGMGGMTGVVGENIIGETVSRAVTDGAPAALDSIEQGVRDGCINNPELGICQ